MQRLSLLKRLLQRRGQFELLIDEPSAPNLGTDVEIATYGKSQKAISAALNTALSAALRGQEHEGRTLVLYHREKGVLVSSSAARALIPVSYTNSAGENVTVHLSGNSHLILPAGSTNVTFGQGAAEKHSGLHLVGRPLSSEHHQGRLLLPTFLNALDPTRGERYAAQRAEVLQLESMNVAPPRAPTSGSPTASDSTVAASLTTAVVVTPAAGKSG